MKYKLFILCILPNVVFANCVDLITLAKEKSVVIEDKEKYQRYVNFYCSEYRKTNGSSKDANFAGAYKYISASFSNSRMSHSDVYSKVCDLQDHVNETNSAYRSYLETIAPGTFEAYKVCVEWSEKDLKVSVPIGSFLPEEMSLAASYSSKVRGSTAELSAYASSGVKCKWNNTRKTVIRLESGSSASLNCTRKKRGEKSYVNVIRDNEATNPMSIAWGQYDTDGNPVNRMADLQSQIDKFKGSVVSFDANECPDGWSEYAPAYGRFVRGIDKNLTSHLDPDKQRPPGDTQKSALQQHTHSLLEVTSQSHGPGGHGVQGYHQGQYRNSVPKTYGVNEEDIVSTETRPENVALLYCIKN